MDRISNDVLPQVFHLEQESIHTKPVDGGTSTGRWGVLNSSGSVPPIQQDPASFLDLTPSESVINTNWAASASEAVAGRDGDTAFIGDISRLLGRVMIEQASEQRKAALDGRLAAREAAKADLLAQANEMEKAAEKMGQGALISLITAVVGGAISLSASIGSSVRSIGQTGTMKSAMGDAEQALGRMKFDRASAKSQTSNSFGQAGNTIGDMTSRSGTASDARAQAEAKKIDADASRSAADAQYQQQIADGKKEIQDAANDMVKQIINFLREMREAEVDAMRSLTRI